MSFLFFIGTQNIVDECALKLNPDVLSPPYPPASDEAGDRYLDTIRGRVCKIPTMAITGSNKVCVKCG